MHDFDEVNRGCLSDYQLDYFVFHCVVLNQYNLFVLVNHNLFQFY